MAFLGTTVHDEVVVFRPLIFWNAVSFFVDTIGRYPPYDSRGVVGIRL